MAVSRALASVVWQTTTVVAGLSLILQLGSCAKTETPSGAAASGASGGRGGRGGDSAPVPVTTARAVEQAMPVEITTIGTGEALSTVDVHAQVTGQLTEVHFTEGQDVEAGQLLFTLDARPFQVAVQQAQAALAKDQAQAKGTEVTRARNEDLFKRELLSRSDYDASQTVATSAAAMVLEDQAALDSANLQLQYTKITSPVTGRTGALLVHQGSLVRSSDTNPLVVINQIAPMRVAFAIPGSTSRRFATASVWHRSTRKRRFRAPPRRSPARCRSSTTRSTPRPARFD